MYALWHTTTARILRGFIKGRNEWLLIFLHDLLMGSLKIAAFFTISEIRLVKFKLIGGNKFCQPANTSGLLGVDCMKRIWADFESPAGSIAPQVLICEAILIHNSDYSRLSFGITHPTIGWIKLIMGNNCSATHSKRIRTGELSVFPRALLGILFH